MTKPPNIILFNPDQFRSDVLAHMGNPAAVTPNLDRLVATDAVSFSQAFCQNPVCIPSRCSFMTGWYPHTAGHRTMRYMLQPNDPMLLKTLRENGYFVWWGGKNDLVAGQNGYADYCDIKYQVSDDPARPMRPNLHSWHEWRGDPDGEDYYSFFFGKIENETDEPYVYDGDWAMIEGAIEFIQDIHPPQCNYFVTLLYFDFDGGAFPERQPVRGAALQYP